MKLQPPGRRAAQAISVVVFVAGALLLVTSLAFLAGAILVDPPAGPGGSAPFLVMALVGVLLLLIGRILLRWGSGDRK